MIQSMAANATGRARRHGLVMALLVCASPPSRGAALTCRTANHGGLTGDFPVFYRAGCAPAV